MIDYSIIRELIMPIVAIGISFWAFRINKKHQLIGIAAKLKDRIYDLDKLILQYPAAWDKLSNESSRTTPFFYADIKDVPRDIMFYQLKGITYFYLNLFSEVQNAIDVGAISSQQEIKEWTSYVIERMRHPLLQEIFTQQASKIYSRDFITFIKNQKSEIEKPCDPNIF
jgi:hypothetical protein